MSQNPSKVWDAPKPQARIVFLMVAYAFERPFSVAAIEAGGPGRSFAFWGFEFALFSEMDA